MGILENARSATSHDYYVVSVVIYQRARNVKFVRTAPRLKLELSHGVAKWKRFPVRHVVNACFIVTEILSKFSETQKL